MSVEKNISLSLVLPCFNEEGNIAQTVRSAAAWFNEQNRSGEIIAVDDGSSDGTAKVLQTLAGEVPLLKLVSHPENRGYGASLRTGCDAATSDVIAFMDSDGQFRVSDLEKLLALFPEAKFVSGVRAHRADNAMRILNAKMYGWLLQRALHLKIKDINCGMKLFSKEIWPIIRPRQATGALFNAEVYLRLQHAKIPWAEVPVGHYPRVHGTPTGARISVILRMFTELRALRKDVSAGR